MIYDTSDLFNQPAPSGGIPATLSIKPPFLWPDTRYLAKHAAYPEMPPMEEVVRDANLISGVLVDVTEETLIWLERLLGLDPTRRIRLVVVISPACPTRSSRSRHRLLLKLWRLRFNVSDGNRLRRSA